MKKKVAKAYWLSACRKFNGLPLDQHWIANQSAAHLLPVQIGTPLVSPRWLNSERANKAVRSDLVIMENSPEDAPASQETESLLKRLAGPSSGKAGSVMPLISLVIY